MVSKIHTILVDAGVLEDALLDVETAFEVALKRITKTVAEVWVGLQGVDGRVTVETLCCTTSGH